MEKRHVFQQNLLTRVTFFPLCLIPSSVSEGELHQRLCSESVLLIRREDVLQRLTPDCCLSNLSDPRWTALDIEGEAVIYACIDCSFLCGMRTFYQCFSPHFLPVRSSKTDAPGRGRRWSQVNTHHHPCSVQLRHHSLRPTTVRVRTGTPQCSWSPFVVTGLTLIYCDMKNKNHNLTLLILVFRISRYPPCWSDCPGRDASKRKRVTNQISRD